MSRPAVAAIPPGALDLTGEAARRRRRLQRAAMDLLERAGYDELLPPTFEYEDTFLRAGGAGVAERLVRFPDRDGRILALRFDFTASIARVASTTFADAVKPLRLSYSGRVYRQEPERGGRPRETLQVGAELLGESGLAADLEMVRLTLALVRSAGLQDFQVNLGHVGVLAPGLEAVDEPLRTQVRHWIDRKDRGNLCRALAGAGGPAQTLTALPFVIGRRAALEGAAEAAPAGARAALQHLLALDAALSADERGHVVYDLGEVRGLDYYTGMQFEVYVAGTGRAVGAGGRYDELMGRFGRPRAAVGVSLDLDSIAEVPA
ncbi:MAG TPA: ATP phosphoribosyltransferase regulatory subunit [Gemmatimonadales bacterium]|jgi:ATP phosphoribosyltransferase regulatory subunit|nr:ATP phosphoribosyltransferase regulatory subunit [Gemmatimonadales bacterium]